ncbi:MAG: polysaccharide deacetylase family protein [Acidimicrobiia bacterium]
MRVAVAVLTLAVAACSSTNARSAPTRASTAVPSSTTAITTTPTAVVPAPSPGPAPTGVGLPPVIEHGARDQARVAITFDSNLTDAMLRKLDDGKVASYANTAVIDELDRLDVPATFFLAGKWMERYPDLTKRLVADPRFELGSHSYEHRAFRMPCYGLGALPPDQFASDVERSFTVLRRFTAQPTSYFRFPGGCLDDAALRGVAPTGVTVVQYDVASGDAFGTSVKAIVSDTLRQTKNGSVIVMHVTGGDTAPLTAQALPAIVEGLRSRGFQLVKLSDLMRGS